MKHPSRSWGVGRGEVARSFGCTRTEKQYIFMRCHSERERAKVLQRLGGSRATKHSNDARDIMSVESCSPSMVCDTEEVSSESSKKVKDMNEITSEVLWTTVTKGREKKVWRLEPDGQAEKPEAVCGARWWAFPWILKEKSRHRQARAKMARKQREPYWSSGER